MCLGSRADTSAAVVEAPLAPEWRPHPKPEPEPAAAAAPSPRKARKLLRLVAASAGVGFTAHSLRTGAVEGMVARRVESIRIDWSQYVLWRVSRLAVPSTESA